MVGKISKGFGSIPKPRGGILGGKMKLMKPSGKLPKLGYNMKRPGVMLKPMSMKKPKMGRL